MDRYRALASNSLSTVVANYLKDKILTGELKGGDRLVETEIAETLGISRAPVREGIQELANQGLISSVPRKGNSVVKFTLGDIKEIFDIRLLLENSIIDSLIADNKLTSADIEELKQIVDDMVAIAQERVDAERKIIKLNEKDIEFHSFLWKKSGSNRKVKILRDLFLQLRIAMVIDTKMTGDLGKTARDHYEIVKYLELKDAEKCKQALKEHIDITERKSLVVIDS